jgi:hypothetical protein
VSRVEGIAISLAHMSWNVVVPLRWFVPPSLAKVRVLVGALPVQRQYPPLVPVPSFASTLHSCQYPPLVPVPSFASTLHSCQYPPLPVPSTRASTLLCQYPPLVPVPSFVSTLHSCQRKFVLKSYYTRLLFFFLNPFPHYKCYKISLIDQCNCVLG